MSSYHSAKNSNSPASYVSSPAWSLNSLTGTTGSQAPTTPVMSSIGLPPTPPSAYADSLHGSYNYSSAPCTPPSAPRMRSVPLPPVASGNYGLPTPPTSPQRPGVPLAHPLLVASSQPPIYFDLKRPPTELRLAPQTLNEPASHPPSSYITLVIPGLIWTIEIPSARTVTVNDILRALYEKLQRPADRREYDAHSQPVQQIASSTFAARRRTSGDGLKRIDFLGPKTRFAGMSRIQDGSDRWVVHFV
ncbi:uncharacterized protein STEHIDRAFT_167070 [Stereum hirsutum FP-91666 SS1]|uniref:uncharacterized protein n=1 Tax=Stereum hirsutum (strain FP-91666) TaxID=721885 RepID=UPI000440D830|nr:uncharacterized protein STEHIDRAFT_167070 [Stereum hirsutum FP-91666 SS1]EIM89185.1 hypothetical protein STEHIDRAFT_167070 [Stereum hirsutum FP-91666 SS1]